MNKPLIIYKASAGSGKTFTLATEYISLVVRNPQSYRKILAVTFTNKATEEMKMRIISQLYGIWMQLPDSDKYMNAVKEKTGFEEDLISERAGQALNNLLQNYNYFRVETIDTFFQSILRNMARELDLTTNLRIGLNDVQVEELAVDQLIADLTTTDVLLQWILKYIMENISDDKSWNIISQIKNFGRTIFKDEYKEVSHQLEQKMSDTKFFDAYTEQLRTIRQLAGDRMKEFATNFFETLNSEGLTTDDLANKNRGIASFFIKLQNGIFDPSIENNTVENCLVNPEKWYSKSHPRRELIHSLAESSLIHLLRNAVEERSKQWKLFKTADLTLRHLNQLRLLGSIENKIHELNANNNRFLLSNTQQLLSSLIGENDSPFIFEKIGTQLEHVMIDEFQDTSIIQWRNFKVLLSEIMSHEDSSNLIVGDVKQSIYRWRSGDWRLLNNIEDQFTPQQIDTLPLKTNYRSQRNIIEFNNEFFKHAAELEYLAQREINEQGAEQLKRAYADVIQKIPADKPQNGYVEVKLLPSDGYIEHVFHQLTDIVQDLLSHGARQQDIAILVRTNALIPQIAQYFIEQAPDITIVSDEAFRLDASDAVCILIRALRLLLHSDDILTKAALVKSYQRDILRQNQKDNELLLATTDFDNLLPEKYSGHFEELLSTPIFELVERLYDIFELEKLREQSAYISAFYDQLSAFTNENSTNIAAFLEEWDETICSKTIQSDTSEGIRILSIHKSKGLEYDHVILPFCDWQLEKSSGNILWCQPSETPFNELPIIPIDYSQKQMIGTIYESNYLHEHLQNTVDNLNLLYVAFTRACHNLYVIGRRGSKGNRSTLIEQCIPLLADGLPDSNIEGLENVSDSLCFCYGNLSIPGDSISDDVHKEVTQNPFLRPSTSVPVEIRSFQNKTTFKQSNRSRNFIQNADEEDSKQQNYIQIGCVLHEIFSSIRTTDDIPNALCQLQFEGILYDDQISADRIATLLEKRLSNPQVADWFSPKWTLFNECTILSIEQGQVCEHRPDRVMTDGKEWIIVDFKFGSPKPEYIYQVQQYKDLIASMHPQQPVSGFLWYVYSNKIEKV